MKSKKKSDPSKLLAQCLKVYTMSLSQFSEHIEVPLTTVQTWREGRGSAAVVALLKSLLMVKILEDEKKGLLVVIRNESKDV